MDAIDDPGRREFLTTTGKVTAGAWAASSLGAPTVLRGEAAKDLPVRVGFIGTGTRGIGVLQAAATNPLCRIVAVADVYEPHRQNGVKLSGNPDCQGTHDYHAVLNDPKIEAVFICTPDHWHEKMVLDAISAGKDVYCEKGWTTHIAAAKRIRKAVKRSGTVMQLGHQGRQHAAADVARRMIREGELGEVSLVNVGRMWKSPQHKPPWRWYGGYNQFVRPEPAEVVKRLDWERWLGPAPGIEFNERHFWHWRCYWAYGTGQAGDLLSHEMDHVQSVLGYGIPDTCSTHAANLIWKDDRETPDTWLSSFVFESNQCAVQYQGTFNSNRQQTPEYMGRKGRMIFNAIGQNASQFEIYGDEMAYRPSHQKPLASRFFFAADKEHRKPDHLTDFFQCVRTRAKTQCHEDEAFVEAAVIAMATESLHRKRMVRWDREQEEIV